MLKNDVYMESYQFGDHFFKEPLQHKKNYLLENFHSLPIKESFTLKCIDHLPKPMVSKFYSYEFDYDRDSPDAKFRTNHQLYLEQYRRVLLMILGYANTFWVESTFLNYEETNSHYYCNDTGDFYLIDAILLASLNNLHHSIFSLPDLDLIIEVSSLTATFITDNPDTLALIETIAQTNGLYVHNC